MRKKKIFTFDSPFFSSKDKEMGTWENMIYENGAYKKRSGWRVISTFRSQGTAFAKINGIFEFKGEQSALIVHAGKSLYLCSYDMKERRLLPLPNGVEIKNAKSQGVMWGGLLYLCGMGALLAFDGEKIIKLHGYTGSYAPLTAKGITSKPVGNTGQRWESPSLLTQRRRNSMIGEKSQDGKITFTLDGVAKYGEPFTVNLTLRVKRTEDTENEVTTPYVGTLEGGTEVNTVVSLTLNTQRLTRLVTESAFQAYDRWGNRVQINGLTPKWQVEDGQRLTLFFDAASPYVGQDNITVEFTEDKSDLFPLDGAEHMALVTDKNGKRAFIACGGDLYVSAGELYFPSDGKIAVGQADEKITAIVPMWGKGVGIYKKNSFYWLDSDGSILQVSCASGCVSPFSIATLGYDCVSVGANSIYGVKESNKDQKILYTPYLCASLLNLKRHTKEEIEGAVAVVHKDMLYLFIGTRAYLTTEQSKAYKGVQGMEYQWYTLENCSAACALSVGDSLYMGRENGEIAVFDGGHSDRNSLVLTQESGDFLLKTHMGYTAVTIDSTLGVGIDAILSFPYHFAYLLSCTYDGENGDIHINPGQYLDENGNVAIFENSEVILINEAGEVAYRVKILSTNPSEYTVNCGMLALENGASLSLYTGRDEDEKYTLDEVNGEWVLFYNKMPARLYSTELEELYVNREKEIECTLCTPVCDLGRHKSKTLYSVAVTFTENTRARVRVGVQSKKNAVEKEIVVGSHLDFGSLDFADFTFSPLFKERVEIKMLERSFDYIRVKISSCQGAELGVESLSLIYSE